MSAALRRVVGDLAERDCEYGDSCPSAAHHGPCVGCIARRALLESAQEECNDRNHEGLREFITGCYPSDELPAGERTFSLSCGPLPWMGQDVALLAHAVKGALDSLGQELSETRENLDMTRNTLAYLSATVCLLPSEGPNITVPRGYNLPPLSVEKVGELFSKWREASKKLKDAQEREAVQRSKLERLEALARKSLRLTQGWARPADPAGYQLSNEITAACYEEGIRGD